MKQILAFSGSLRKHSINSGLLQAAVALAAGRDDLLQSAIAAAELSLPRIMRKDFDERLEEIASEAADAVSKPRSRYQAASYGDALRISGKALERLREVFDGVNPPQERYRQPILVGIPSPPSHFDLIKYVDERGRRRRSKAGGLGSAAQGPGSLESIKGWRQGQVRR